MPKQIAKRQKINLKKRKKIFTLVMHEQNEQAGWHNNLNICFNLSKCIILVPL
jgi:hypothetical protein